MPHVLHTEHGLFTLALFPFLQQPIDLFLISQPGDRLIPLFDFDFSSAGSRVVRGQGSSSGSGLSRLCGISPPESQCLRLHLPLMDNCFIIPSTQSLPWWEVHSQQRRKVLPTDCNQLQKLLGKIILLESLSWTLQWETSVKYGTMGSQHNLWLHEH